MTALLESPVGTLDVSLLEQRQPDVPLTCTRGMGGMDSELHDPCTETAKWEGLCMGCGHVFRRCQAHYLEDLDDAAEWEDGVSHQCAQCHAYFYVANYVRIGA